MNSIISRSGALKGTFGNSHLDDFTHTLCRRFEIDFDPTDFASDKRNPFDIFLAVAAIKQIKTELDLNEAVSLNNAPSGLFIFTVYLFSEERFKGMLESDRASLKAAFGDSELRNGKGIRIGMPQGLTLGTDCLVILLRELKTLADRCGIVLEIDFKDGVPSSVPDAYKCLAEVMATIFEHSAHEA